MKVVGVWECQRCNNESDFVANMDHVIHGQIIDTSLTVCMNCNKFSEQKVASIRIIENIVFVTLQLTGSYVNDDYDF